MIKKAIIHAGSATHLYTPSAAHLYTALTSGECEVRSSIWSPTTPKRRAKGDPTLENATSRSPSPAAQNGRETDGEHRYDRGIRSLMHHWKAPIIPLSFQEQYGAQPPPRGGLKATRRWKTPPRITIVLYRHFTLEKRR